MPLIEFKNVTKAFYANRSKDALQIALNDVSLSVEEGEFVSLLGPSGCGKSVTLRMMAGFDQPSLGEVLFEGKPILKPGPERGVVFQDYSLFPWLSVQENVEYPLNQPGLSKSQKAELALSALKAVGLEEHADKRPNLLSGGMKQRVAIARLLAMDARVFLMDEPFSALDEQTRLALDAHLFELWRERRKTVVFVTHSIEEAVSISSRIVLFSESPGGIIGEWQLDEGLDRSPRSEELAKIKDEIRNVFPAATF